ncbi:MAG TPA: alpha/beta hydrolase family protein [Chthoniobacteraceae bacterium]
MKTSLALLLASWAGLAAVLGQTPVKEPQELLPAPFDRYFTRRVAEISSVDWQSTITPENWPETQAQMRLQLRGMLGLDPWPTRGPLSPVITGTVPGDGYLVEKLYFQSLPGLYVTANLYRPTEVAQPLPAILIVCGHSKVIEDGVSLGNKTAVEHKGAWYARHGYVVLAIDTIELGEIMGEHHGTYRQGRWWWQARGYTPAGVEAWNGIRALDYLESRPEVDRKRIGVTGRSGGGASSWWIAALDDRVSVAAPTAGITTLKNHVLDGVIEGHCDCMFTVNTDRWDYDRVAALVAPRPLVICNTDKDEIFPLDGVMEIYNHTRALYKKLGFEKNIGLQIAEGPHAETEPLYTGEIHWMGRFLQGADPKAISDEPARHRMQPAALRVFDKLPEDEKVTTIDQIFAPVEPPPAASPSAQEWARQRDHWLEALKSDCCRAWPATAPGAEATKTAEVVAEGLRLTGWEFSPEEPFQFTLWLLHRDGLPRENTTRVILQPLDDAGWKRWSAIAAAGFPAQFPDATPDRPHFNGEQKKLLGGDEIVAFFSPRGAGPTSFASHTRFKQTQLLRRFPLIGETLESGQVWDIRQAAFALRSIPGLAKTPLELKGEGVMGANALYASLFIPRVERIDLTGLPATQKNGPIYLNVLRHLDLPQAVALAAERTNVTLHGDDPTAWSYARGVSAALDWGGHRIQIVR